MKAVILAGGLGTRISEESHLRPKPMVEIGGYPMLWHIMKIYAHFGVTDFIICLGYRGYMIKEYFANYVLHRSDVTVDLGNNAIEYHNRKSENWRITLAETGEHTMTGGRLKRISQYLEPGESFCATYGDGLTDLDIKSLIAFHKSHGCEATMTVTLPPGRYGATDLDGTRVKRFLEKPSGGGGYINGGFFVLETSVLDRIEGDETLWELEPLEGIAAEGQLQAFKHDGYWKAMDTLREKNQLEELWATGNAPWKVWD